MARTGGRREYNYFMQKFCLAERAEEKTMYLAVLASFTDTVLVNEVLGRRKCYIFWSAVVLTLNLFAGIEGRNQIRQKKVFSASVAHFSF